MRVGIALSIAAATRRPLSKRTAANMDARATSSNSELSRQGYCSSRKGLWATEITSSAEIWTKRWNEPRGCQNKRLRSSAISKDHAHEYPLRNGHVTITLVSSSNGTGTDKGDIPAGDEVFIYCWRLVEFCLDRLDHGIW
jgi:hypothetical protein